MFLGLLIFLIGLFLVLDSNNKISARLPRRSDKALEIVRERYARGELSAEEFHTIKNALSEH